MATPIGNLKAKIGDNEILFSPTGIYFSCFPTKFETRLYFQQFNVNFFQMGGFP